eukprot:1565209-Amphidinium_carterae.3
MQRKQSQGCATHVPVTFEGELPSTHASCEAGTLKLAERLSIEISATSYPGHALMVAAEHNSSSTRKPPAAAAEVPKARQG